MSHPSYLALDVSAAGGAAPAELGRHLEQCAQCRAHVAAARAAVPMPAAVQALPRAAAPRGWRLPRWSFAVSGALVAGVVAAVLWPREAPPVLTAKGAPAAQVWLSRGGKVALWKGEALQPGDAVRLEVALAGRSHVTVYDERARRVLYEAIVRDGGTALTPAWALDDAAGAEQLRVFVTDAPLTPAELKTPCTSTPQQWCSTFTLPRGTP